MKNDNDIDHIDNLLIDGRTKDADALARICEIYYPKILKFMRYRVDREYAEDLTNDVFLKVIRSIGDQNGQFNPWIYRIARNVTIDFYRRRQSHSEIQLGKENEENLAARSNTVNEISNVLDIEQALDVLSDEQREIVVLRFIQGLSCDEVAEVTDKTSGAVRAMQFRSLKLLKEAMNRQGQQ